jgi:DNA-binding NarL/FixJ family response regulator
MMRLPAGTPALIVDDDDACRRLTAHVLERAGCTTHEAATGDAGIDLAQVVRPRLAIIDVCLPNVSGYEVCRALREDLEDSVAIIFLSGRRTEAVDRVAGFLLGADDYLGKPFEPDELIARARLALRRRGNESRRIERRRPSATALLTRREREILVLLATGRNQSQIATELVISPKTVATHIQRILTKLDVHSRAEAVAVAHREWLVSPTT